MANNNSVSPVKRSTKEAKENYNRISGWYDLFSCFEKKYREKALEKLSLTKTEHVLEIGFGTGHSLQYMSNQQGKTSFGNIAGIDLSEKMCFKTKKRLYKNNTYQKVSLVCADANFLPFISKSFDAIFISFTLELFKKEEIKKVLSECKRILTFNGRLCVIALSKKEKSGLMVKIYEWTHRVFPKIVDCRPIFTQKEIRNAGFQIKDLIEKKMFGLPIEIIVAEKA